MPVNISMSDFINGNFPVGTYYGFTRRQDGRIDLLTEGGDIPALALTQEQVENLQELSSLPPSSGDFILNHGGGGIGDYTWSPLPPE